MHPARDSKQPTTPGKGPRRGGVSRSEARSLACEHLESRWLLTGDYVVDSFEPQADQALVSAPLDTEPVAYPMAVTLPSSAEVDPLVGSATPGGFAPDQLRHAYGFDQVFFDGGTIVGDGTGQTIAIVNAFHTPTAAADLAAFNSYFGLPDPPSFVQVDQTGGTDYPSTNSGWALETALDVQWAHAFAPGADIVLVEADSAGFSDLMVAVDYARNLTDVSIVSLSWGTSGEFSTETNYDFHFTTPVGHQGVTFFAAAGNSGSPGSYPAYSSNVVAVGGTSLSLDGSNNIASETAWSGSGGGISQYESQPFWQNGIVTQTATQRAMPDVAFDANPSTGVPVYDTFNNSVSTPWTKVAGTSFATPSWAALVAVANQGRVEAGLPVFDLTELMTTLYAMPATNFNDITSGTSSGATPQTAGPGYDLITGRGTPKAQLVVADLVGETLAPAVVSGTVYVDANGNGTLDGESGLAGWTVYADLNTNGVFDTASVDYFNSGDVPQAISTFGAVTLTSDEVVSGLTGNIVDVNVTLDISHTRTSDLVITLIAPDNTEIVLASHVGGSGDNFSGTTFDDSAAASIASGTAPFSGSFRPTGSLAALLGADPNGTWQLRVEDTVFFQGGSLNSWSLEITTGEPNTVSEADGTYVLEGLSDGAYQIRQVGQSPYVQTEPGGGFYTVNLAGGQSASERDFGNQLPQTGAPTAVVLAPSSDSGISSSDAITKLNNSSPGTTLQFEVLGTIAGATVTLEADGTPIGSAIAAGSTTIITTDGSTTLADGVRNITAQQTAPGQPTSSDSPILAVTIDTTAPVSSIVAVTPDPRSAPVDDMTISFNEWVSGLDLNGLQLVRDSGSDLLGGSQTIDTADGFTWTLHDLTSITAAAGYYELFLSPALSPATDAAGNVAAADSSDFTVALAAVADRLLFYNQSIFDSNDAAINAGDDAAIATDKFAYVAGDGPAAADNVSSYVRGINGLMVDIANPGGTITADDFTFRISGTGLDVTNTPNTWADAPAPLDFSVRPAAGTNGSDRVEFIWADGAIANVWLQVIVEGDDDVGGFNTNTGLAASDVFYFGNVIGDTFSGGGAGIFVVDASDEIEARNNQGVALAASNAYDFNRDKSVDASDQIIARGNTGFLTAIDIASPAPAPAAAPSTAEQSSSDDSPAPVATARRKFDPNMAFALATEHWRRQLLANAAWNDWFDQVDEPLVDLLGRHRLASRR